MSTAVKEVVGEGGRGDRRRWRFFVHKLQMTYAIRLSFWLFLYALVIFGVAFFAPYIIPAMKLLSPVPLAERANAAAQFLVLSQTVFPAIFVLIMGAGFFSIYLTKRLGGPLYRIEQVAKELRQGNLALRVKFRQGDKLDELAGTINEALMNLDRALGEIRSRETNERAVLRRALNEMKVDPSASQERLEEVELAIKEGEGIAEVIKRFRLSDAP